MFLLTLLLASPAGADEGSLPSGDDPVALAPQALNRLPLVSRTSAVDFVRRQWPEAQPSQGALPTLLGRDPLLLRIDDFTFGEDWLPLSALARGRVLPFGGGAAAARASGGLVELESRAGEGDHAGGAAWLGHDQEARERVRGPASLTESQQGVVWASLAPAAGRLQLFGTAELSRRRLSPSEDPFGRYRPGGDERGRGLRGALTARWALTSAQTLRSLTLFEDSSSDEVEPSAGDPRTGRHDFDERRLFTSLAWQMRVHPTLRLGAQAGVSRRRQATFPGGCRERVCLAHPDPTQTFPVSTGLAGGGRHERTDEDGIEAVARVDWQPGATGPVRHAFALVGRGRRRSLSAGEARPDQLITLNGTAFDQRTEFFANDPRLEPEARTGWWFARTQAISLDLSLEDRIVLPHGLAVVPGLSLARDSADAGRGGQLVDAALLPHLGTSWDPFGDARTLFRLGLHQRLRDTLADDALFGEGEPVTRTCRWNDAVGMFNGACRFTGGGGARTLGLPCGPTGVDQHGAPCRKSMTEPRSWEIAAGLSQRLGAGFTAEADLLHRRTSGERYSEETNRIWNSAGTALSPSAAFANGTATSVLDRSPFGSERLWAVVPAIRLERPSWMGRAAYVWERQQPPGDLGLGTTHRQALRLQLAVAIARFASLGATYAWDRGKDLVSRPRPPSTPQDNYLAPSPGRSDRGCVISPSVSG